MSSRENQVLDPWLPIEFINKENNASVKVWGREYIFENSLFPVAVETAGKNILAAPIKLCGFFEGIEKEFSDTTYLIMEKTDARVVFHVSQTAGNVICNGRVTIEYDGFIQIAFSMIPFWSYSKNNGKVPSLDKLYIDIPIKKEFASLYHYWPNADTSILPDPNIINSGALPKDGVILPFKPYIWSGWENGGIGICAESDQNIELTDKTKAIEYIVGEDNVIIRINLLDQIPAGWEGRVDNWTDTLKPIDYIFGLQATPVKAFPENAEDAWRIYHYGYNDVDSLDDILKHDPSIGGALIDELAANGVKWIILHEAWSIIQNYGLAKDEAAVKQLIQEFHKRDIKVMVYFGYEYSTLAPDWFEKAKEYLIHTPQGQYTGGWQRKPHQRAFMACYQGGYSEVMQDRIRFVMDEYKVDGIYTDGTYVPWECANETHACGYKDKEGKVHTTFPIFAVREHVKKIYDMVHERGGIIDTHQSSCCLAPTLAFCDTYYDGENIQGAIKNNMQSLSLDAFRAEYMGKNLGIPAQFIASTRLPDYTIQKISSVTLIHDTFPRAANVMSLRYLSSIWKLFSNFGTVSAYWHPYWEKNNPVKALNDKVYCSAYEKDKELLVVVSSFDEAIESVELSISKSKFTAINAFDQTNLKVIDNIITLPIKSYDPQIIHIILK